MGFEYTGSSDLTPANTKLLVKLLSPETANIKNIFNQKTLLYTKVVETGTTWRPRRTSRG